MAKFRSIIIATLLAILPTLLLWAPFFLRIGNFWTIPIPKEGMATVVANYDGPLYIAVAKSFYTTDILKHFNFNLPIEYYAAHFPLYPILIRGFAFAVGYPYAMLVVTVISSILAVFAFSKFIADFVNKKDVVWMTFIFSIFPARWLIVRSVGSPEPLFLATIIFSVYFFKKEKIFLSGLFGALAALTKSPGILLFPALVGAYLTPIVKDSLNVKGKKLIASYGKIFYLALIPIATLLVFILYKEKFSDFFAYFHSGDNIHLMFPPFQIFNSTEPWVGTFWLEEVIFVYLLGAIGISKLLKKDTVSVWFTIILFLTTLFIAHRDIVRYSLPIVPFLLASYSDYLTKKEFRIAFALIVIPIYLFSLTFISNNVMPIPDWGPLL